ncbi:MAG: hypothetical protein H0W96_15780, partial [Solirubrobacterales bacterium]|nr:hypothetical protein [Solirubrobacterales bacterium]
MATETMQLLLPDGLAAAAVSDALAVRVAIVSQQAHTIDRTFLDTFDGRLQRAGMALAATAGRLALLDAASSIEHAAQTHKRVQKPLLATDLPRGALRGRLEPLIEMRALTPIVRVRSRQLPLNVLDDIGKIVVRLRVEEPTALGVRVGAGIALPARLHVVGVLGYD